MPDDGLGTDSEGIDIIVSISLIAHVKISSSALLEKTWRSKTFKNEAK